MTLKNQAADTIRQAIKSNGYKHYYIAKRVGLSPNKLSAFLNGKVLTRELIEDLADLLCLNQKELLIQNTEYEIALATEKLKLLQKE